MPFPKLPKLSSLASLARRAPKRQPPPVTISTLPTSSVRRASFLRRGLISRRGPARTRVAYGDSPEELRAAQDVTWELANRIVLAELRRRRLQFTFSDDSQLGGIASAAGWSVDFLILSFTPPVALDVVFNQSGQLTENQETKAAFIRGAGIRYVTLWDQVVLESALSLEQALDEELGVEVGAEGAAARSGTAQPSSPAIHDYLHLLPDFAPQSDRESF